MDFIRGVPGPAPSVRFVSIFAYVLKDQWSERSAAEATAISRAGLTEIDQAQKSVWDENAIYWVLTGKTRPEPK